MLDEEEHSSSMRSFAGCSRLAMLAKKCRLSNLKKASEEKKLFTSIYTSPKIIQVRCSSQTEKEQAKAKRVKNSIQKISF